MTLSPREIEARERARELLVFARGFDAAGGGDAELARQARLAARDVLGLIGALEGERSARRAVQAARDNAVRILERHAGEAAARATRV